MFPTAMVMSPGTTRLSDAGIVKVIPNVSGPSAISSVLTGTSIVVLVVSAVKVAVIGVEV